MGWAGPSEPRREALTKATPTDLLLVATEAATDDEEEEGAAMEGVLVLLASALPSALASFFVSTCASMSHHLER